METKIWRAIIAIIAIAIICMVAVTSVSTTTQSRLSETIKKLEAFDKWQTEFDDAVASVINDPSEETISNLRRVHTKWKERLALQQIQIRSQTNR